MDTDVISWFSLLWIECGWCELLPCEGCWIAVCCNHENQCITFSCLGAFTEDCTRRQRLSWSSQWRFNSKEFCACVWIAGWSCCKYPAMMRVWQKKKKSFHDVYLLCFLSIINGEACLFSHVLKAIFLQYATSFSAFFLLHLVSLGFTLFLQKKKKNSNVSSWSNIDVYTKSTCTRYTSITTILARISNTVGKR